MFLLLSGAKNTQVECSLTTGSLFDYTAPDSTLQSEGSVLYFPMCTSNAAGCPPKPSKTPFIPATSPVLHGSSLPTHLPIFSYIQWTSWMWMYTSPFLLCNLFCRRPCLLRLPLNCKAISTPQQTPHTPSGMSVTWTVVAVPRHPQGTSLAYEESHLGLPWLSKDCYNQLLVISASLLLAHRGSLIVMAVSAYNENPGWWTLKHPRDHAQCRLLAEQRNVFVEMF